MSRKEDEHARYINAMHLRESGIHLYKRPGFRYGFTEALKA